MCERENQEIIQARIEIIYEKLILKVYEGTGLTSTWNQALAGLFRIMTLCAW